MSFEPNKEHFMAQIKSEDFDVSTLIEDEAAVKEILWYIDVKRRGEILDEIFNPQTPRKDAETAIRNLAKLYPLSRDLVLAIMLSGKPPQYPDKKQIYRDAAFLEGFDMAENVRKAIIQTFKDIEWNLGNLSKETKDYLKSIESLQADQTNLKNAAQNLDELKNQRDELQKNVEQLRRDTDEKNLNEDIERLNVEIQRLEGEKRRRQTEIDEKGKRIAEVTAELKNLENKLNSSEEIKMLQDLLKKFPADAED